MTDFLIVGRGLSACTLMHAFDSRGISFTTFGDPTLSRSSLVAAGIWNPVVFKRLTAGWKAEELIGCLKRFYRSCEARTGRKLINERDLLRPFSEEQEEVLWQGRAKTTLSGLIDPDIHRDQSKLRGMKVLRGYGRVPVAGNLDVQEFIRGTESVFRDRIVDGKFDHDRLTISEGRINYYDIPAQNIVFCEGHLVRKNPFFSWLPLKPAKGEILAVHAEDIDIGNAIFNRNGFLMRKKEGEFVTGSTYRWDDLTDGPTDAMRIELCAQLETMTNAPYRVVDHKAGVRPSSIDLRPIAGRHPRHDRLWVFNGLGSKGVMLAPWLAENFVNFYLNSSPLHPEVNAERFYSLYEST
jgi:glycine oxidase